MAKYHIASDGMAKPCKATVKACPLGENTVHGEFANAEAAQQWAEQVLEVEYTASPQVPSRSDGLAPGGDPKFLLPARVERRVASALKGQDEHWDVVPGSEVRATAEALVARVDADNYPAVLKTFQSMVRKDKGRDVFAQINALGEAAVKFNPAAAIDVASLRMGAASVPAKK